MVVVDASTVVVASSALTRDVELTVVETVDVDVAGWMFR